MTKREFRYHQWKRNLAFLNDIIDWDMPETINPNAKICEYEGCSHFATVECELDYQDETTNEWKVQTEWLCSTHAEEEGYCMGCGTFIAGTGMEFANNGYCDNCYDQIRENDFDDEEDFCDGSLNY